MRQDPRHEGLQSVHDAPEIHVHYPVPVAHPRGFGPATNADARVVTDDMHASKGIDGCLRGGLDLLELRDVHLKARDLGAPSP